MGNADRKIARWLLFVSAFIAFIVVFGGWVRLTRSGLSIVEWNVFTGVVPPLTAADWQEEFAKYRQTPEYHTVNAGMALEEFQFIYYMEYAHRLLGRLVGLAFVLPLFYFLFRGAIPWRRAPAYAGIGLLFALQGLVGWLMVKSGLVDRPSVSHLRLTLHLFCALLLMAGCLWLAFGYLFPSSGRPARGPLRRSSALLLAAVALQIAAGGLVAGLKAGHISDTFPMMFGQWIPAGLWTLQPKMVNMVDNPVLVHFQHRFFAFAVLALALHLWVRARRDSQPSHLALAARLTLLLVVLQVGLGAATVLLHVPISLASLHQAAAVLILATALLACHRAYRG